MQIFSNSMEVLDKFRQPTGSPNPGPSADPDSSNTRLTYHWTCFLPWPLQRCKPQSIAPSRRQPFFPLLPSDDGDISSRPLSISSDILRIVSARLLLLGLFLLLSHLSNFHHLLCFPTSSNHISLYVFQVHQSSYAGLQENNRFQLFPCYSVSNV